MKRSLRPSILTIVLVAGALLTYPTTMLSTASGAQMQSAQPSVSQAQPQGQSQQQNEGSENSQSDDQGRHLTSDGARRPLHRIDEGREGGFEKLQLILVGAAIVIAIGLAYRAGRRRRDS